MNKFELVQIVLTLIERNEIDKAKNIIREKRRELRQTEVKGVREEINEIIRSMSAIDKEILLFKLKKMKLAELSPEVSLDLEAYIDKLTKRRAMLAKQKKMKAKENVK